VELYIVSPMEPRFKKAINTFAYDDDNEDQKAIQSFGDEWTRFSKFSDHDIKFAGEQFRI
jgi:hypothetical protein